MAPPGSYNWIVAHPSRPETEAMEVATFHEHRFAFFYWNRWRVENPTKPRPDLISLDWHRDLAAPDSYERGILRGLDLSNMTGTAVASWIELHPHDDGHVLAAAYLDLIGDVYVVQKHRDGPEPDLVDVKGQIHKVRCFASIDELLDKAKREGVENIYLDIDLDFFTESDDPNGGGEVRLLERESAREVIDPDGPLLSFAFPRLQGMTIALEPKFCGGLSNSHRLFGWVDNSLFDPGLGYPGCRWRHLL